MPSDFASRARLAEQMGIMDLHRVSRANMRLLESLGRGFTEEQQQRIEEQQPGTEIPSKPTQQNMGRSTSRSRTNARKRD